MRKRQRIILRKRESPLAYLTVGVLEIGEAYHSRTSYFGRVYSAIAPRRCASFNSSSLFLSFVGAFDGLLVCGGGISGAARAAAFSCSCGCPVAAVGTYRRINSTIAVAIRTTKAVSHCSIALVKDAMSYILSFAIDSLIVPRPGIYGLACCSLYAFQNTCSIRLEL